MKNKIIALMLSLCLLIGLCGCATSKNPNSNKDNKKPENNKNTTISIAYNGTDSFNPFIAETSLNRNVATLIFDSLFFIDNNLHLLYNFYKDMF